MRNASRVLLALLLAVSVVSCDSNDKTDSGGISISIGEQVTRIDSVSVSAASAVGEVVWPRIDLVSLVTNANGTGSQNQMDVLLQSYEVFFTRGDGGTRVPPPLVRFFTGSLPANGTLRIQSLPILGPEQLNSLPLSNLLPINGGLDRETGKDFVMLNANIRFYGKTIGGREIASPTIAYSIVFVP